MATDLETLVVSLEARIKSYETTMQRALGLTNSRAKQIETRFQRLSKDIEGSFAGLGSRIGAGLAAVGVGIGTAEIARNVTEAAQRYTDLQNALKVTGLQGAELDRTFNDLFQIAQKNGTALEPLVTLYSRASQAQKELGASTEQLKTFTDGVSTALRVAGTSTQEASGALLQLSQLLGSGTVHAEEFNSVNEGARPILQAVAAGLKEAGGSVATLKTLVNDGKVSSQAFFQAFLAGMPLLTEQAARATQTVGQATNRVQNAFTMLVGELDKTVGASATAAQNLSNVARVMEGLPQYIDPAIAKLKELQGWFNSVGNNPIWTKLATLLGADMSPEGLRKAGITPLDNGKVASQDRIGSAFDIAAAAPKGSLEQYAKGLYGPQLPPGSQSNKIKPVSLASFPVSGAKNGSGSGSDTKDSFERSEDAIRRRTALLQAETDAVGKSTFETEKAKAAVELEEAAKRAGITITDSYRQKIDQLSTSYGQAAQALENARDKQQQFQELQQFIGDNLSSFFSDIVTGSATVEDSLKRIVSALADAALQAALLGQGPLAGLFGTTGAGGKTGGLIGALGGLFRASGGPVQSGKTYLVGEQGPELVRFGRNGTVVPNAALPSGGGGGNVQVNVVNQNGSDVQTRSTMTPSGPQIELLIRDAVAKDLASNGQLARQLQGMYGLNRMGGR